MKLLESKKNITSLVLVEQINIFRKEEDVKRKELAHNDLLKIIRNEFEEEIGIGELSHTLYTHEQNGQVYPMFVLTISQAKQVLVRESKFVRKSMIAYIEKIEQAIQPMSQLDIMAMSVALLQEQAKQIEAVNNRIDKIEAKQLTSGIDYYTVIGFASLNKVKITPSQANILGRKCSSRSRSMGVPKQNIHDPRYGLVGGYHEEILEFVFMQEGYL